MSMEQPGKEKVVLSQDQFAMYRDRASSGELKLLVGPTVADPSMTDEPIMFTRDGGFEVCTRAEAVQRFISAAENQYVVLGNPEATGRHPRAKFKEVPTDIHLETGTSINLFGPCNFALWPGQFAEVIAGHHLRTNEYAVIRITNEELARKNWTTSIVKVTKSTDGEEVKETVIQTPSFGEIPNDIAVGKRYIIKGTDISFYMPPTGVTVERAPTGEWVRSAVTLERLQYCIMIDESGEKRYPKGPNVVFPAPTEKFVELAGEVKHQAVQLNPLQGCLFKVIDDFEENGRQYKIGEEIFITGKEKPIFFPREELALQSYDSKAKHFATCIPKGTGRYVLKRMTGDIPLIKGPDMKLLDPRDEVFVRRPLTDAEVKLWYPANCARGGEALKYNQQLREMVKQAPTTRTGAISEGELTRRSTRRSRVKGKAIAPGDLITDSGGGSFTLSSMEAESVGVSYAASVDSASAGSSFSNDLAMQQVRHGNQGVGMADRLEQSSTYTQPRQLTFGNRFDGAPTINLRQGYAVNVTDAENNSRLVIGPALIIMEYTETLQVLSLSTGKIKAHDRTVDQVYLQVSNNQVSDTVTVETSDHVEIMLSLSYRVNFEGDSALWFKVENYVKLITDHARSVLKGAAKHLSFDELMADGTGFVRDTVLGKKDSVGSDNTVTLGRQGMSFEENGVRIHDVEVFEVVVADQQVGDIRKRAEFEVVKSVIDRKRSTRHLEDVRAQEAINQELASVHESTLAHDRTIELASIEDKLAIILANADAKSAEFEKNLEEAKAKDQIDEFGFNASIARQQKAAEVQYAIDERSQALRLSVLKATTEAEVSKYEAIQTHLSGAITVLSNNDTAKIVSQAALAVQRMFKMNLKDAIGPALEGTGIGEFLVGKGLATPSNGTSKTVTPPSPTTQRS